MGAYAKNHENKLNLIIHLFAVPLFIGGNIGALVCIVQEQPIYALAAIALIPISLMLQGLGHKMEEMQPAPFKGPLNFIRRIYIEQFITFPCFFLTGKIWKAFGAKKNRGVSNY